MTSGHSAFTNGGSRHVEGLGRSRSTIRAEFKSNGSPKPGGSSEHSSTCAKFLLYLTASPSLYALFAGIVTLAGWFWQWRQLTDWNNSGISMFANTALAAMCAGLAILMRLLQRPWASTMSSGLGALVAIIGCLTLFEHLSGINLGIDTLIITPKWGERAAVSSGRMGPPASTCFTLLGVALVLAANNWRARRAVPALGVIVIAISLLPVIGYLFDADPLFALARLTGIAMQTATVLLALGFAVLGSVPDLEPTATLCRNTAGSVLARRALPFVFALPVLFGWLFICGRRAGLFDRGLGTALLVLSLLGFLCGLLWWCVADVTRHERASQNSATKLRRKNKQLAAFLETAAIGLHRVSPDGQILWANAAEMDMLGYAPEEYIGQHIAKFHADQCVIDNILKRLTCGEKLLGCEARLRCKDGSVKHVLIDSSVLWEDGRFIHTQCFTRDITEKKHAEDALRESEQRLRATFSQAAVGIAVADLNGKFSETNQKFNEIVGYASDELRHMTVIDLTHPDDLPKTREHMARVLNGEVPSYVYEKRFLRKDGSIVWTVATVTVIKDSYGKAMRFIGVAEDITERKRTEEKAALLAAIVEHSDDAIFSTDLDGVIKSWNHGAERLYGYASTEALGQSVMILIPEGREKEERGILERIRHGQTVLNYETFRRRKDGTLFDVSLTVSPIKDAKGQIFGVSKVARDITEKVRAKERLEETVAKRTALLQEAVSQMEEFSYSVSHDLRAPLRAMSSYSGALLEEYGAQLDDIGRSYLQKIQRSADRMNRLTQEVLTYSRIARAEVQLSPIDLERLIKDIIHQYAYLQPPEAVIQIDAPLHNVVGQETTFGQCIANLLNNAVKFVAPGVKPRVRIRTEHCGRSVRIWFEDNGIGIKPAHHERIFQMFERVHPEGKYEGTGIGLTIVRKAVEKMDGKVGVESDGQNGSRFWIELPGVNQGG